MEKGEEGEEGMTQLSVFECAFPTIKTKKKIRLIELFAGIGAQAKALENLGADFEHWKVCEYDKYAVKSYNAIHGTSFKPSDIRNIHGKYLEISDLEKYFYIMTYSFPCQDLSMAGKQTGMKKGEGTRSGLLWEVERILHELSRGGQLPQMLLMENVPAVHGKRNVDDFADWIRLLDDIGYQSYWKDLNATDFGIPQNRDRCFMVSVLGRYSFSFPEGFQLEKSLEDMLEEEVDEKYFLSEDRVEKMQRDPYKANRYIHENGSGNIRTITAHESRGTSCVEVCRTIRTEGGGLLDKSHMWDLASVCVKSKIGQIKGSFESVGRVYSASEVCQTTNTCGVGGSAPMIEYEKRVRRLTERELFRLMGFSDDDFDKASKVNSSTQIKKQAGNSIVVPVLEAIFKQILED